MTVNDNEGGDVDSVGETLAKSKDNVIIEGEEVVKVIEMGAHSFEENVTVDDNEGGNVEFVAEKLAKSTDSVIVEDEEGGKDTSEGALLQWGNKVEGPAEESSEMGNKDSQDHN